MGAVDDLAVVETVGFLNSSFPHQTTKTLLELINEFSKAEINTQGTKYKGYKINTQNSVVFLHTNNVPSEREINNHSYNCIQKIPRNKFNRRRKHT